MNVAGTLMRVGFIAFSTILVAADPARASLVLALDLPELTIQSDHVVLGETLSTSSAWDDNHRTITTAVEIQVAESWKGGVKSGERLVIYQPGGVVDDVEMRVFGIASFQVGERAVLFLRGHREGLSVVGMAQGKRPLHRDRASGHWFADAADRNEAVVKDSKGRLHSAPPESRVPLDVLRGRIRSLVESR